MSKGAVDYDPFVEQFAIREGCGTKVKNDFLRISLSFPH